MMGQVSDFLLPASLVILVVSLVAASLFPLPSGLDGQTLLIAVLSGVLRTLSLGILLYTFRMEEVSRVIPIIYSYPVLVAIMAVPLLGEALSYLEWLAIIIVVSGAIMVSAERNTAGNKSWLRRTTFYLTVAGVCFASADVTTKYVLGYISFWNAYALTAVSISSAFFIFSMRLQTIRELRDMKQRKLTLTMLVLNEIIAPMAIILSYWAMQRGPVSLVSTIVGSRPVFVAIYTIIISRILPGFLMKIPSMKVFMLRLVAILMIFGGISIIYLI